MLAAMAASRIMEKNAAQARRESRRWLENMIAIGANANTRPRFSGSSAAPNAANAPALCQSARQGRIFLLERLAPEWLGSFLRVFR
jgi:hypothetical protein